MEGVVLELISQWGVLGLVLAGIVYLIWDGIKQKRKNQEKEAERSANIVGNIEKHVDEKIDTVNDRIDAVDAKVDTHYDLTNQRIDNISNLVVSKLKDEKIQENQQHVAKVFDQFVQAPKLHRILKLYRERIGCDHIFLGLFHNGTKSIGGIPFCKFDVVAEKFKPGQNRDFREYTVLYKDSDIIVHDNLPIYASQEDYIYFRINEDGSSELEELDDILYRRCIKFGIKQFAANILRDENMNPLGFVGCVDYDYDQLNFHELNNCAKEIEEIYKD